MKTNLNIGGTLAGMAAIVSISTAADLIIDYLKKKYQQYKSREYFIKMLETNPQLQKEDPLVVARYWESLNHFAPGMAEDPLAAGAYITQSMRKLSGEQLGGPPPDTFDVLSKIQKQLTEADPKKGNTSSTTIARQEAIRRVVGGMF